MLEVSKQFYRSITKAYYQYCLHHIRAGCPNFSISSGMLIHQFISHYYSCDSRWTLLFKPLNQSEHMAVTDTNSLHQ